LVDGVCGRRGGRVRIGRAEDSWESGGPAERAEGTCQHGGGRCGQTSCGAVGGMVEEMRWVWSSAVPRRYVSDDDFLLSGHDDPLNIVTTQVTLDFPKAFRSFI
jgi:hypothetical protein